MSTVEHASSTRTRSKSTENHLRTILVGRKSAVGPFREDSLIASLDNRVYTLITFLPKNLFEQFRRIANFYFLCIAIIQSTTNSPVSPATSLTPLIFVVSTTAIKQAWEDWLRHQNDNAANKRKVQVLAGDGQLNKINCEEIHVGDIVKVNEHDEIPCDLVLLSSSDFESKCHITTANLDGETSLKVRKSLECTSNLASPSQLKDLNAVIECESPNTDLYEFRGNFKTYEGNLLDKQFALSEGNLVLRGARLKNTSQIFGVAVYTGPDTKMMMNSRLTSNKFSSIERKLNRFLIIYLVILLILSTIFMIAKFWFRNSIKDAWYLNGLPLHTNRTTFVTGFQDFLSFFVLFNYLIPISLYVTLEMVKFFGAKTLVSDKKLIDYENGERPICNTSDLNEDLGQVEYLFSDKTGTLTQNKMEFRACIIDDALFNEVNGQLHLAKPNDIKETTVRKFLLAICLCNNAQVFIKGQAADSNSKSHNYEYHSASPDEKTLIEAANRFGVILTNSNQKSFTVSMGDNIFTFQKLQIFDFDSHRKRMSVIVKDIDGQIALICKGADTMINEGTGEGEVRVISQGKIKEIEEQVDVYARSGLRTLVMAYKFLTPDEYAQIVSEVEEARTKLSNKKNEISNVYSKIEKEMILMGATAVEDRLQEGVGETITDLKRAGIKVWLLTGDKWETAISVSKSCSLFAGDMEELRLQRQLDSDNCNRLIDNYLDKVKNRSANYALIIDGKSLDTCLRNSKEKFRNLGEQCAVVLCCRMSPIQKAEVVRLIKESPSNPVTAAIGDGANDVSMLQEAHVGFGLMGKEGRQAVNSSDFAFGKFKFVKRILLVHGHYFYLRVAILIQYFFYKNVVFVTPQVLYAFFSAYSAQTLFHSVLLMIYNLMMTSGPIFIYALIEKHIPMFILESYPQLYKNISRNSYMTFGKFALWFMEGVWHGAVSFFGFCILWGSTSSLFEDGRFGGVYALGILTYHAVIFIVTFKLVIITREWDINYLSVVFLTILTLPVFMLIYTNFKWGVIDDELFGLYNPYLFSLSFWLSLLIITFFALLPDIVYNVVINTLSSMNFYMLFRRDNTKVIE